MLRIKFSAVAIRLDVKLKRARVVLILVGINQQSSAVTVGEKFWLSKLPRYEALRQLARADCFPAGVVLATCNQAEFILRAGDTHDHFGSAR